MIRIYFRDRGTFVRAVKVLQDMGVTYTATKDRLEPRGRYCIDVLGLSGE